jgi:acyl carrier protein
VAGTLVALKPSLDPALIRLESSLTADLGLDSLDLVELAAQLGDHYGRIDLGPWFASAMQPGGDTVASLTAYLAALLEGRGADR